MIFSCYEFQKPIETEEGKISTLVIENPVFYRDLISDMLLQSENGSSRFSISKDNETLNFSKKAEIITDVFSLNFGSRTFQTKLNQIVLEEATLLDINLKELIDRVNEIGSKIVSALDFDTNYVPVSDLSGIIKLLGFYFDSDALSLPEKIIEYLSFLNRFTEKELFIIVNLKSILTEKEFSEFAKLILYKKINLILVESQNSMFVDSYESIRIIDKDLCEI